WSETPLRLVDNDGWAGSFLLGRNTRYHYTIEAWTDVFASWCEEMSRRVAAGQVDLSSELSEGRALLTTAQATASRAQDIALLAYVIEQLRDADGTQAQLDLLLDPAVRQAMARAQERRDRTRFDRELQVMVDRPEARYAAWYELFPRSQATRPGQHGTFDDCIERLADIQRMGFDVLYLPPIHPIG